MMGRYNRYIIALAYSLAGGLIWAFVITIPIRTLPNMASFNISQERAKVIVLMGTLFGIFLYLVMIGVFSLMEALKKRALEKKYGPLRDLLPVQSRTVLVRIDYQSAVERCMKGLSAIGATGGMTDPARGIITARTKRSMSSWGENIEVKISLKGTSELELTICSEPVWWTALWDYGQGVKNVEELRRALVA